MPRINVALRHLERKRFSHLLDDRLRLFETVRAHQHLPLAQAFLFRLIVLDVGHGRRLLAPGMVHQQLRIDPEFLDKHVLIRMS